MRRPKSSTARNSARELQRCNSSGQSCQPPSKHWSCKWRSAAGTHQRTHNKQTQAPIRSPPRCPSRIIRGLRCRLRRLGCPRAQRHLRQLLERRPKRKPRLVVRSPKPRQKQLRKRPRKLERRLSPRRKRSRRRPLSPPVKHLRELNRSSMPIKGDNKRSRQRPTQDVSKSPAKARRSPGTSPRAGVANKRVVTRRTQARVKSPGERLWKG
jgi:hypothetical protein